jgi:glyoxylase-like metal-dependent hydrolase (beta-lactamase superfamily II)
MQTHTLNDNLTQMNRFHFVNAYLVREDDGFTLIDTTLGGGADDLIGAAQAAGGTIRRIALTHGHSDHAGSLDALKQRLGDQVEVLMPELDARILAGEKVTDRKLTGSWPKQLQTTPDVRINGGDRVGSLEVISSPGHTPGHVAFLDTRDNTLIAGDVYTSYGRVAVTTQYYLRFPLATMGTFDKPLDLESARSLRTLDPGLLVVGHGPAVRDPGPAMDRAIALAGGAPAASGAGARP